ncbi:hypothetical protein [uncultured Lamprocystis sp.]|jgi:hypothetical protein|uniref:hypothetical protein n=1 Tax=uncultured Lamprocystis sp. TaxID=543132 RepID=UPI0025F8AC45|nr:hypothetical protein [uncultured Lamprocystis sp.]
MPLFVGKDAEQCEEWFRELLRLRYPDIDFFGDGRKYVARKDSSGHISVQLCRATADYRQAQQPGFGSGEIIHSGLELMLQDPANWNERPINHRVTTASSIRDDRRILAHLKTLLATIREIGFVPDEECACDFKSRREAAFAEMERDLDHIEEEDFDPYVDPVLTHRRKGYLDSSWFRMPGISAGRFGRSAFGVTTRVTNGLTIA